MSTASPAAAVRLWIGLSLFTIINLGIWVSSELVHRPDPGLVRVIEASSAVELERSGVLRIRLDRDIYAEDQVGSDLERSPFRIEPSITGTWRIEETDALAFEPVDPPPAGRIYRVALASAHPMFRKYEFDDDTLPNLRYRPMELHHLRLTDVGNATEGADASERRLARFQFTFNQPVLRSALIAATTISVDGTVTQPTPLRDRLESHHSLEVLVRPGSTVGVLIDSRLTGHDGRLELDQKIRRRFQIAGNLVDLRASATNHWGSPSNREIRIHFDRRLDPTQILPSATITPDPGPIRWKVDGNDFVARADYRSNRTYAVRIEPPLLAIDRSLLQKPIVRTVTTPPPPKAVSLSMPDGQLMPTGGLKIPIRHSGYDEVRLQVHRLVDEHLPMVLAEVVGGRSLPRVGDEIFDDILPLESDESSATETDIDLGSMIDRRPGLYRLNVTPGENRWNGDRAIVLVSDLAIDLQITRDEILAWVTSVSSGRPVEGANLVAWAPNITPVANAISDSDGVARLPLDGDSCRVVTATRGDDVIFARTKLARGIEDRSLAGAAWTGPMDIALHADRGIHRPGETVHLSGILRTVTGTVPETTPIEVRWIRPDERVMQTKEVLTDPAQGTFSVDVPTAPDDPTGIWIASCRLPGSDDEISRIECRIMPFLPVRLEVATEAVVPESPSVLTAQDPLEISVTASYLHGAPAAGLDGTITHQLRPVRYRNGAFPDFRFEPTTKTAKIATEQKVQTDKNGQARIEIDPPIARATWSLVSVASIREPGGRSTSSTVRKTFDNAVRHLGIRVPGGRVHGSDAPIDVDVIEILGGTGSIQGEPTFELLAVDNRWYRTEEYGRGVQTWKSRETTTPVTNLEVRELPQEEGSIRRFQLDALPDGAYRLVTKLEESTDLPAVVTSIDFHVSKWRSEGRLALERPDRVELLPDHDTIRPDETMPVLIRTPFPGTALITVETDRIHQVHVVEVEGDGVKIDLLIPPSVRDTCFVAATLVRAVDPTRESWQAVVARGAARLTVDQSPHRIQPSILASDAARPGEVVRVTVAVPDAGPGAMARIWAVEEGALLATGFRAPDPTGSFLRDRRRMVNSMSTLEDLIEDVTRPVGTDRIGGDAASRLREPIPVRIPETRVIWRDFETVGPDGMIDVDLIMPELDGALRVMAVVADGDRYGAVEQKIGLVSPIQIVAAFPRAAAPGDRMKVPTTIRNNTTLDQNVEIRIETGDGLTVMPHPQTVSLPAGSETLVQIELEATSVGSTPVLLRAIPTDGSPGTNLEWAIAIRPPFPRMSETRRFLVPKGESVSIERDRSLEFFDGRIEITAGSSPQIDLAPVVEDLIDYPYGCAEQIGSRVSGLLAAARAPSVAGSRRSDACLDLAANGLGRLWLTQRSDGRIPYWRSMGGDEWVTIRTALITQRALDLGVRAPHEFLSRMIDATAIIARRSGLDRSIAAMAARVLAQGGRPDAALIERLFLERENLRLDDRAHLAAALAAVGRTQDSRGVIDSFSPPPPFTPRQSGVFTCDGTQIAIALSVALKEAPDAGIIPVLHENLVARRRENGWRTTYENAAAVDALVSWGNRNPPTEEVRGSIEIAGERIVYSGGADLHRVIIPTTDRPNATRVAERIASDGDGSFSVVVTTSGYPKDTGLDEPDHRGLKLDRRWFDAVGSPIEVGSVIAAGQVVIVELEWSSTLGRDVPHVAMVEVLPGGMEFELPQLVTSATTETTFDAIDRVEFRDDRLLAFDTFTQGTQRLRYAMRAVVPGDWIVPGTRAEAMYESAVRSQLPQHSMEIAFE